MAISAELMDILVCPIDKGDLTYIPEDNVLLNERLGKAYRIEDDIPVLLAEKAFDWNKNS
ncbi:Trm112 family protein [Corynebacterium sp. sy017]|uniref:Trm112 family protein n=1 Tax=unclassified Corynebacterium TaxID=2624378 RepID=UPI00118648DC|nr:MULTISPECIES: Trm112 family protein [unclassified Corynebacterium]MBP3089192.1 Trm112 family protein [Corynebacterium sp. sy017]QDZ42543.1 Trm112 family protein [Corynebacterium sp. sy039]TSD91502.1 Trm112 family protein [Corynebacterium sp. SY003]